MNDLAARLIAYRAKHGLTQIQMVQRIGGVSLESLRKWEYGITEPNPENLKRIEKVLNEN